MTSSLRTLWVLVEVSRDLYVSGHPMDFGEEVQRPETAPKLG